MALSAVMKRLGQDMRAVTGAISREDWALVAELAPKIAAHDEPPLTEKMRILTWLGTDAGKFRSFDTQVHDAANGMGKAAMRGDGPAVIDAFARVHQACLGCHQGFRKSFVEHFQEKR
jgi:cytochrome c556